jgi:hypothetical protein
MTRLELEIQNPMDLQVLLPLLERLRIRYTRREESISSIVQDVDEKEQNRQAILALAGSWEDMSEEDFEDYLREAKSTTSN